MNKIIIYSRKNIVFSSHLRFFCTRYSKSHEWVRMLEKGNLATIGISSFSSSFIGKLDTVKLETEVNSHYKSNDPIGIVGSINSIKEVHTPISGKCIEMNHEIVKEPNLIDESPERKGWLIKIEVDDHKTFNKLMTREQYQKYLNDEVGGNFITSKNNIGDSETIILG
ncbi:hypothetical protein RB653_008270 [Dictyostelium firmibasis]|uniref:Glycine cleavage system H protein n=1 Tax=Dictyostelium firmibasis TaxID=79012 RepID=A0AAN7UCC3_9MYCE